MCGEALKCRPGLLLQPEFVVADVLRRTLTRKYVTEITDGLVPALQRRGLIRTSYTYEHFRDNLLE